jgi:hypothetical protein
MEEEEEEEEEDPFKPAVHVSGANYAHPRERLTVFTAFGMIHQRCCRPVTQLTVSPVGND